MNRQSHLGLDDLADVLAGQVEAGPAEHLRECRACTSALAALRTADGAVTAVLTALPEPALPPDLARRLEQAVEQERRLGSAPAAATVTPLDHGRAGRRSLAGRTSAWSGAVAAAAVLVTGGFLLARGSHDGSTSSAKTSAGPAARSDAAAGIPTSATGNDYAKDGKALAAALPRLLNAGPADAPSSLAPGASAPQALAGIVRGAALTECLAALNDPGDSTQPLALDYARFDGTPALVVVLPSAAHDKVDVFVVGPDCSRADARVRFFTRLTAPSP